MNILEKLAPRPIDVDLSLRQGDEVIMAETVTICLPTFLEWEEIEADVLNPAVPLTRIEGGKKFPNPADPDYKDALRAAESERQMRLVAFALVKGGNPIPGKTLEDQADALIGAAQSGFLLGIYRFMIATLGMEARRQEVADRADGFHPAQAGGNADLLADGTDAHGLAEPE